MVVCQLLCTIGTATSYHHYSYRAKNLNNHAVSSVTIKIALAAGLIKITGILQLASLTPLRWEIRNLADTHVGQQITVLSRTLKLNLGWIAFLATHLVHLRHKGFSMFVYNMEGTQAGRQDKKIWLSPFRYRSDVLADTSGYYPLVVSPPHLNLDS